MEKSVSTALSDDAANFSDSSRVWSRAPIQTTSLGATTRVMMSAASHVLMAACTSFVIYLACQQNVLFSWHPACMALGTFLLTTSILVLSPHNYLATKVKRQSRIRLHYIVQASVAVFLIVGFLIVYINKNLMEKNHFTSNHGLLGLFTLILYVVTASGGIIALYSTNLQVWVKPALIKFVHNCAGVLTFMLVIITITLGSWWVASKSSFTVQVIYLVTISLATILALESSLKSAHGRYKSLVS